MKEFSFRFRAYGHPNITATHSTTLEITTDDHVTSRGDCIVAVKASCGIRDLAPHIQSALSRDDGFASLKIRADGRSFRVRGRGSRGLTFQHPRDIVIRTSGFVSDRTLMVDADKAARDIPRSFLSFLQDERKELSIGILVT